MAEPLYPNLPRAQTALVNKYRAIGPQIQQLPPEVRRALLQMDVDRVQRGANPLSYQSEHRQSETEVAISSMLGGATQKPSKNILQRALGDIRDIGVGVSKMLIPPLTPGLARQNPLVQEFQALGDPRTFQGVQGLGEISQLPLLRWLPGAYWAEALGTGQPGLLLEHPVMAALDILPYAQRGVTQLARAGRLGAEGGELAARMQQAALTSNRPRGLFFEEPLVPLTKFAKEAVPPARRAQAAAFLEQRGPIGRFFAQQTTPHRDVAEAFNIEKARMGAEFADLRATKVEQLRKHGVSPERSEELARIVQAEPDRIAGLPANERAFIDEYGQGTDWALEQLSGFQREFEGEVYNAGVADRLERYRNTRLEPAAQEVIDATENARIGGMLGQLPELSVRQQVDLITEAIDTDRASVQMASNVEKSLVVSGVDTAPLREAIGNWRTHRSRKVKSGMAKDVWEAREAELRNEVADEFRRAAEAPVAEGQMTPGQLRSETTALLNEPPPIPEPPRGGLDQQQMRKLRNRLTVHEGAMESPRARQPKKAMELAEGLANVEPRLRPALERLKAAERNWVAARGGGTPKQRKSAFRHLVATIEDATDLPVELIGDITARNQIPANVATRDLGVFVEKNRLPRWRRTASQLRRIGETAHAANVDTITNTVEEALRRFDEQLNGRVVDGKRQLGLVEMLEQVDGQISEATVRVDRLGALAEARRLADMAGTRRLPDRARRILDELKNVEDPLAEIARLNERIDALEAQRGQLHPRFAQADSQLRRAVGTMDDYVGNTITAGQAPLHPFLQQHFGGVGSEAFPLLRDRARFIAELKRASTSTDRSSQLAFARALRGPFSDQLADWATSPTGVRAVDDAVEQAREVLRYGDPLDETQKQAIWGTFRDEFRAFADEAARFELTPEDVARRKNIASQREWLIPPRRERPRPGGVDITPPSKYAAKVTDISRALADENYNTAAKQALSLADQLDRIGLNDQAERFRAVGREATRLTALPKLEELALRMRENADTRAAKVTSAESALRRHREIFEGLKAKNLPGRWAPLRDKLARDSLAHLFESGQISEKLAARLEKKVAAGKLTEGEADALVHIDYDVDQMVRWAREGDTELIEATVRNPEMTGIIQEAFRDADSEVRRMMAEGVEPPRYVHSVPVGRETAIRHPSPRTTAGLTPTQTRERVQNMAPAYPDMYLSLTHQLYEVVRYHGTQRFVDQFDQMGLSKPYEQVAAELEPRVQRRARRTGRDERVVRTEMIQELYEIWDKDAVVQRRPVSGRWKVRRPATGNRAAQAGDVLIPRSLAKTLRELTTPTDSALAKMADPALGLFRSSVLAFSPRWHAYNLLSGAVMLLARTGPSILQDFAEARRMMRIPEVRESFRQSQAIIREGTERMPPEISHGALGIPEDLGPGPRDTGISMWDNLSPELQGTTRSWMRRLTTARDLSYSLNGMIDDMYRALAYLYGKRKDVPNPEAYGVELANKVMQDWNRHTPFERSALRYALPFYGWIKHILGYVFTYPFDHPMRAAFVGNFARTEIADRETGLPDRFDNMVQISGDEEGRGQFLSLRGANPFADVSEYLSWEGLVGNLNPMAQVFLESSGVNPITGSAELFPATTYDEETGRLKAARPSVWSTAVRSFVPQAGVVQDIFLPSADTQRLAREQPDVYQARIASGLGVPFGLTSVFPPRGREFDLREEIARAGIALNTQMWNDVREGLKSGDWSRISRWPQLRPALPLLEQWAQQGLLDQYQAPASLADLLAG